MPSTMKSFFKPSGMVRSKVTRSRKPVRAYKAQKRITDTIPTLQRRKSDFRDTIREIDSELGSGTWIASDVSSESLQSLVADYTKMYPNADALQTALDIVRKVPYLTKKTNAQLLVPPIRTVFDIMKADGSYEDFNYKPDSFQDKVEDRVDSPRVLPHVKSLNIMDMLKKKTKKRDLVSPDPAEAFKFESSDDVPLERLTKKYKRAEKKQSTASD
jgi:hypothetical protein